MPDFTGGFRSQFAKKGGVSTLEVDTLG